MDQWHDSEERPHGNDLVLAVVVNDRIAAITRSSEADDGKTEFEAMIPRGAFVDGKNDVDLVRIRGVGPDREFSRVRVQRGVGVTASVIQRRKRSNQRGGASSKMGELKSNVGGDHPGSSSRRGSPPEFRS